MISSSHRPLPDNTQRSQQINIRVHGGIRTHDPSRRAATDLRLRPRGYWDRQDGNTVFAKHCCPPTGLFGTFICSSYVFLFLHLLMRGERMSFVILSVSTEQSPSFERSRPWAAQKIPSILWSLKVQYCFPTKSHLRLFLARWIHSISSYFFMIFFNIIAHLHIGFASDLFPSGFPTVTHFSPPYVPHASFDLPTLMTPAKGWKSWSFAVLNFLHSPVSSLSVQIS